MATIPSQQESARLESLRSYKILDTDPEKGFDDITYLASYICETPIATLTLVDADRQWFKSKQGLEARETPRNISFCTHAIEQREVFVVPDATKDERFRSSPLVQQDPKIRFYAGMPLFGREGHALGTLCVIDRKPRELSVRQAVALSALTRQAQAQLELRRNLIDLKEALAARDRAEAARERLIEELQQSLSDVRRLSDIVSVSSACRLNVTVPADVNAIQPVIDGIHEIARQMRSAKGKENEIELAVREALANAIVHGCGQDPSKKIQCTVACDESEGMVIVVRDPGKGFDLNAVPDPTLDANLTSSHGRGIYLINELMEEVEFVIETSGRQPGTEVRMKTGTSTAAKAS